MLWVNSIIFLPWQVVIFPGRCLSVLLAGLLGDDTHSLRLGMRDGDARCFSLCLTLTGSKCTRINTHTCTGSLRASLNSTFGLSGEADVAVCSRSEIYSHARLGQTLRQVGPTLSKIYGSWDIVSCWLSIGHSDNEMEIGRASLEEQNRAEHFPLFLINHLAPQTIMLDLCHCLFTSLHSQGSCSACW